MVGPAEQGQVGQVGGAAMQPVAQVVGVAPGQGPLAVGEDTAAVADRQGGALGGLDDPGGPADLQRLGGGARPGSGAAAASRLGAGPPARRSHSDEVGVGPGRWGRGRGRDGGGRDGGWGGWRVTSTRVTAPSQASRRQASGSRGPAQPSSPPTAPGWPRRLSRSTITLSWGRTPPVWGSRPPSRAAAGQFGQGIGVALGAAAGVVGVGRAGQRLQGGQEGLAGLGLQQPIHRDHAFEGGGQPQPPAVMTSLPVTVGAVGVGDLEQVAEEPPQPGWVQPSGRLDQDWFGVGGDVVGEGVGAGGEDLGVGDRQLARRTRPGRFRSAGPGTGLGRSGRRWWPPGRSAGAGCAARPRSNRPGRRPRPRRRRGHRPRRVL